MGAPHHEHHIWGRCRIICIEDVARLFLEPFYPVSNDEEEETTYDFAFVVVWLVQ